MSARPCSKVACGRDAVATLTYDYADAMAVLGPLAIRREPHSYDLCERHAERLSAPQGWQIVRHVMPSGAMSADEYSATGELQS
ncbi:MAG: DUF3499 family protein [Protaetiibacter sp.]